MTFRDYSFGYKVLGQGLSSVVYKAKKFKSKQQFALKIIKEDFLKSQFEKKLLLNQIDVHQAVNHHKNFVQLFQHGKHENSYVFVMEYCQKGSLADFLQKNKQLSETQAIYIIKEVIEAYKLLHELKILHRDIKPANILITQKNQVKLCDFGLSVKMSDSHRAQNARIGTPCFMAPEVAKRAPFTPKSDIWSIGVTYFLLLVGELPYKSQNYQNFLKQVDEIKLQTLIPCNLSQFSRNFILKTLSTDPSQRMSPDQLFNFQFQSKPIRHLKPSVSQRDIRQRPNKSLTLDKTASTNNLGKTLQDQTLPSPSKNGNETIKNFIKTEMTQSSQSNLKAITQNAIKNIKTSVSPINSLSPRTPRITRTPMKSLTPKTPKEQRKDTSISPKKEQASKKQIEKPLTKQEQKLLMKQMQKITKILMNQIDFLRYTTKMIDSIQKYFKGEFQHLKELMRHFVCVKFTQLNHLTFIQKDKIKTYMKFPIYKAWVELLDDYSKTVKFSQKGKFRQEEFESQLSKVILQIYMEFDISFKTRLNASRLVTLDHLVCFRDLLNMSKKGELYFLKNSMLNLILEGIEKMRINTQDIETVFSGISKKLTGSGYS